MRRTISCRRQDDIQAVGLNDIRAFSVADVGSSSISAAAAIQGGGDDAAGVAGAFAAGEESLELRVLE